MDATDLTNTLIERAPEIKNTCLNKYSVIGRVRRANFPGGYRLHGEMKMSEEHAAPVGPYCHRLQCQINKACFLGKGKTN